VTLVILISITLGMALAILAANKAADGRPVEGTLACVISGALLSIPFIVILGAIK